MKLLAYIHMYPGSRELGFAGHNAGSETTVRAYFSELVRRGHQVTVLCDRSPVEYELEGVKVVRPPRRGQQSWITAFAKDFDMLATQLDYTKQAMQLSLDAHKPLVHFVHNDMQLAHHHVQPHKAQLVVFNSEWVAKKKERWHFTHNYAVEWPGASIILHPIVEPDRYRTTRGDRITLVNPTPGKGARTFYELARRMPLEFLVVKSVYGEQILPPYQFTMPDGTKFCDDLPNVAVMEHTPDIREALCQTKVLLMPSDYESYGRIAVEAACCGIPSIVHPTPGLKESLGEAGIFIDRNDFDGYQAEIERLYQDEVYYRKRSDLALALADSLDPESEFDRLENALLVTLERWLSKERDIVAKMWTSDRRLYYDKNGQVTDKKEDGVSLCCGIGGRIPEELAVRLGFVSEPTHQVVPQFDSKAINAPEENKAISAPEQNKAIKTSRKRKVA